MSYALSAYLQTMETASRMNAYLHTMQGSRKTEQPDVRRPSKYHREIKPGVLIDVYDVIAAFGVTNPADAHAIKKLLMAGQRGHKNGETDRREAIQAIERAIELEQPHE